MNKYNNPRLLNTVVSGTGMKNPVRPHVIIGSEENGFIRGDLMDANAIQELIVTEIAAREHGDEELTEYIDEKVQLAVDDLVDGAPEVLDTLKELSEALGDDANFATTITEEIASKVDKVEGKGLSTNDYTTAEKQKLAGIAAGAEVNVQSDWSLTNSSNDDFIKNKPTKLSQFANDVPYATQDYIINNFETKTRVTELKQSIKEKIDNIESVLPKADNTNGHEYVDLGLPSGTKWAKMNVGASSEKDAGLYFAWGETQGYAASQVGTGEGQKAFSWSDYALTEDSGSTMSKYNASDNKTHLELTDDAAAANMGGDWHMPNRAQYIELFKETKNGFVTNAGDFTQYAWDDNNSYSSPTQTTDAISGWDTAGYFFFKSDVSDMNAAITSGDYLFIPAAGDCEDGNVYNVGSFGYVWAPALVSEYVKTAWYFYFNSDGAGVDGISDRFGGQPVRGVINAEDVTKTFVQVASKDDVDELKENLTFTETTTDPTNGHAYVDLGLPSGTLWATMNVGAKKESDYGLYFAWGETEGYADASTKSFTLSDYKFNPSGDGETFTKYNATDGKTVLDLEDDATHANWGGEWHMPTNEQCKELINGTTHAWTTIGVVKGYKFTSKSDNSKYIFIPAASLALDGKVDAISANGFVWSSSRSTSYVPNASHLGFYSKNVSVSDDRRYYGHSVRGVLDGDAQVETTITPVKEVVTDLKSNEEVIAAALNNLNTGIEVLNLHKSNVDNKIVEFDEVKQSFEDGLFVIAEAITKLKVRLDELDIKVEDNIDEVTTYATKFTPDTVGVDDAAGVFNYNVNQLQELVTDNNTEMLLTTTRNNKKLIVGTIRFFTDNFAHQVTAIATSNIHLDEWDKESSLSGVSHTDGKAYTYVCFCGLNDPAAYSGLQEGVWTDWKKLYPTMDDLDEAVNTLKNRQYMDSSTFDAIFTEANSDAIGYIIDSFAPTFYVKDSSNNVVTCSIVRSATAVCVTRNKVDNTTYTFINECKRGTIGSSGSINWSDWTTISSTVTPPPAA